MFGHLFRKREKPETPRRKKKQKVKLTRAERKRLDEAVAKVRKKGHGPGTAQETIPYKKMYPDGICQVDDTHFSKTVQYYDINYQLSHHDEKLTVLDEWGDFLNFFDPSVHFQFSFVNLQNGAVETGYDFTPLPHDEAFDQIAEEAKAFLESMYAMGSNDDARMKFCTFTVTADNLRAAKLHLNQVEGGINEHLRRLGCAHETLNGKERLWLLHTILHLDKRDKFSFDWKWLPVTGLSTKDFIAPSSFEFRENRVFRMGEKYCTVSAVQILASRLDDRLLADLLTLDNSMIVTMHIQAYDQAEAVKLIKQKLSDLDRTKIDEQMKASRSGYDIDILPSDLNLYGKAAREILDMLQNKDQKMFMLTMLVMNTADTKARLKTVLDQVKAITQPKECPIINLDFQQEDGFVSSLPLGFNKIEIQRIMTTSAVAVLIPFTTMELFQKTPEALYCGINALSHNIIMVDRKSGSNANGIILGIPGSGKSFAAKREMLFVILFTKDDVIICDPEGEYYSLVKRMNGQVIRIAPNSKHYINPLDLDLESYSKDDDPLAMKAEFILSLCEMILGGKDGLEAVQKSVIDYALKKIYQRYFQDPKPENLPILGDLYEALRDMHNERADYVADALDIYVNGSLNLFNHHTNVDIKNRVVCFDIKDLGTQLKKMGMLIVQEMVWNRLAANRDSGKYTRYYMDEFHVLLKEPQTAAYSVQIWKRFRKWGGIPTGITQNIKDLTGQQGTDNILDNTSFIYMLSQAPGDRKALTEHLNLSPHQLSHVTNVGSGEGLLFFGNTIIPFEDHFPKDTEMYKLLTTKPSEVQQRKEEEING